MTNLLDPAKEVLFTDLTFLKFTAVSENLSWKH